MPPDDPHRCEERKNRRSAADAQHRRGRREDPNGHGRSNPDVAGAASSSDTPWRKRDDYHSEQRARLRRVEDGLERGAVSQCDKRRGARAGRAERRRMRGARGRSMRDAGNENAEHSLLRENPRKIFGKMRAIGS